MKYNEVNLYKHRTFEYYEIKYAFSFEVIFNSVFIRCFDNNWTVIMGRKIRGLASAIENMSICFKYFLCKP